jgi:ADP-ribose pyrophosphatase YjhB (NUDIX family)
MKATMPTSEAARDAGQAPAAAVSVIVIDGDKVLLVKRGRAPALDLYAFPGGRVDAGETPEEAALRECLEETGLIAHTPSPFAVYDLPDYDSDGRLTSHFLLSVFTAELDARQGREPVAADDAAEAGWYGRADALALPMPESVKECILKVLPEGVSGR